MAILCPNDQQGQTLFDVVAKPEARKTPKTASPKRAKSEPAIQKKHKNNSAKVTRMHTNSNFLSLLSYHWETGFSVV